MTLENDPVAIARSLVDELRVQAADFPQSRKRDLDLYSVLAGSLRLVQLLVRDNLVERYHELLPEGKFLKASSDVYTLAAKLVFDDRYLAWRASYCLRGLAAAGVPPENTIQWLKANGGMNVFAAERRHELKTVSTRFLKLSETLVVARGSTITITLRHLKDTSFEVVGSNMH